MKVIGITGGVGSGKSTVSEILETKYAAFIINTDNIAHQFMQKGRVSYQLITRYFGNEILDTEGEINRGKLGKIVYENPEQLKKLNSFTHPYVMEHVAELIQKKQEDGVKLVGIETALPIEAGLDKICDEIWYIYASEEERKTRLMESRSYTEEKVKAIFKRQLKEEEFLKLSTHTIRNEGSRDSLMDQIQVLLVK